MRRGPGSSVGKQYHIVLSRPFDLDQFDRDASEGKCPRHAMSVLRSALGARVHQPTGRRVKVLDRLAARLFPSTPEQIAMGRALAKQFTEQDVVFAAGEDVGYPLALALRGARRKPRLLVEVHNPRSLRSRLGLKLFSVHKAVDMFVATTPDKVDFVRDYTRLPSARFHAMHEVTDTEFFTPGPSSPTKTRPVVGACGLEQRDYVTLAEATKDMDVDVKICAVSPNATSRRADFPEVPPANMKAEHYDWPDLVQLYRDSDVVAVPLRPNTFQAGQTAIMEAMACARPVVTTEAAGMVADFDRDSLIRTVPERDPKALRHVLESLLERSDEAAAFAARARQRILEGFNTDRYVKHLAELLRDGDVVEGRDDGAATRSQSAQPAPSRQSARRVG